MARRGSADARAAALSELRRTISCITNAVAIDGRAGSSDLPAWTFGARWAPLAGRHDLDFSLLHRYRLVRLESDPGTWIVQTAGYFYQFRERNGDELVRFEWRPLPGLVPFPHLHVHGHDGHIRLSGRMHIPTGVVPLAAVVRFAIEELGVRPLRGDWAGVLAAIDNPPPRPEITRPARHESPIRAPIAPPPRHSGGDPRMPSTRAFSTLTDEIRKDPERAARIDAMRQGMEDAQALARLREEGGLTQQDLADALAVTQANVSRIERAGDLCLSTLRRYVEAMGGSLENVAVFPERRVPLTVGSADYPTDD